MIYISFEYENTTYSLKLHEGDEISRSIRDIYCLQNNIYRKGKDVNQFQYNEDRNFLIQSVLKNFKYFLNYDYIVKEDGIVSKYNTLERKKVK